MPMSHAPPTRRTNSDIRRGSHANARELHVYDGQMCIATIKVAEDGNAVAFTPGGKRLGSFASDKDAIAAINLPRKVARS